MCVHRDAIDHVKHLVEHDVCGLDNARERDRVFIVPGTSPPYSVSKFAPSHHAVLACAPEADGLDDLSQPSAALAAAMDVASGQQRNSSGVTLFTAASVVCAKA